VGAAILTHPILPEQSLPIQRCWTIWGHLC